MRHRHTRRPRHQKIVLLDASDLMVRLRLDSVEAVARRLRELGIPFHANERGLMVDGRELEEGLARKAD